jgi:hypothetical protein
MSTRPKDDIGYESGGWPATDLPNLATKAAPRRKGRSVLRWTPVLAALAAAASYLLYYYAPIGR